MNKLKKEFSIFIHALSFFTALPLPHFEYNEEHQRKALAHFPLIGLMIGPILITSFFCFSLYFNHSIAVILVLIAEIFITRALHDDALADCFDGLYGGFSPEQRIIIMQDSRLGSFGALALIATFALRAQTLFLSQHIFQALIAGAFLSRFLTVFSIYFVPFKKRPASKSKHLAQGLNYRLIFIALVCLGLFIYQFRPSMLLLLVLLPYALWILLLKRKLNLLTGDCLGATQRITETLIYLILCLKQS